MNCEWMIAVTDFMGTPQEVVTLYFYESEDVTKQSFDRMCRVGQNVRLCKIVEERNYA